VNAPPRLYFITGISGSGKTSVARRLQELGEVTLDSKLQEGLFLFTDKDGKAPEDYRPRDQDWKENYSWVLNKRLFDTLMEENRRAKRVFLCGGADDLMRYWSAGEKVFLLWIDLPTMLKRLDRQNLGKDDVLRERLERYQNTKIEAGAVPIDAIRPVEEVVQQILDQTTP